MFSSRSKNTDGSVLSVKGLKKSFRKPLGHKSLIKSFRRETVDALKSISFDIPSGTVTGFLGANGAGKTTTIKCLLGLAIPDNGEISFFGGSPLTPEVKRRIGFLPERPYFYEYLTGREFLRFYGELSTDISQADLRARITALLKRVGLDHAGDRPLRGYSKGMLQRVGIAQALIHGPDFIILDEPMTGLDPDGRLEVREIIRETAQSGTAVFFSSHLLPDAETLCDRLVILKQGDLVYQGATKDLLGRVENGYRIQSAKDGQLETKTIATAEELQKVIDQERARHASIIEIHPLRLSLEEAFVRIAMNPDSRRNSGARPGRMAP
jgi:ABC-2 type transport system ATP-binding protein